MHKHTLARRAGTGIRRLVPLFLILGASALSSPARANTITVTGLGDALTNNAVCTIREAVINANNDAATWPDCSAGSGADVINLPAGTITLSIANTPDSFSAEELAAKGDLDITTSMTINGNAAGTTINGSDLDRIFDVDPVPFTDPPTTPPTITVDINDLTITNGRINGDGGALRVFQNATVTVDNVTLSANTCWANDAGAIDNHGTLTLTNCTISGNDALLIAGAIKNEGTLTLTSCTVTANTSSFANLTGGIWNSGGTTTLRNTIVAGNSGVDEPNLRGNFVSAGYNVIGDLGTEVGNPIITATTGDQFGVGLASVHLGLLASNGGPTQTHALLPGSVAIDKGHSSSSTTDQRGETRPCDDAAISNASGGDGSDVGAFEVQGTCSSNSAPDAVDDSATVAEDSGANAIDILGNDTDADGDTLTVTAVSQGANGAVTNNGTSVSYEPSVNFFGSDSFTYTISDGNGHSDTATVSIGVTNVNDAPVASSDAYDVNQDTTLSVPSPGVLGNDTDIDGDTLTAVYTSGNGPHHGILTLNANGSFSYTPNASFTGTDTFNYRAYDGVVASNAATVTITIHDTQPPTVVCTLGTTLLWPPNGDLVNVGFDISATDNDGLAPILQIDVFSDEDDEMPTGSGIFSPDARNVAPGTLRLRSERRGDSDGRVYVIRTRATDASNNTSVTYCTVIVPKSQKPADMGSASAQAAAAVAGFIANGNNPPAGFFVVGDGPFIGSKQ